MSISSKNSIYIVLTGCTISILFLINIIPSPIICKGRRCNGETNVQVNVTSKVSVHHRRKQIDRQNIQIKMPRQKIIIIWTMWRSGSNFLHQVLSEMPDTFSFTEPIHNWQNQEHLRSGESGSNFHRGKLNKVSKIMNFYIDVLHCRLSNYPGSWQTIQWHYPNLLMDPFCTGIFSILGFCQDIQNLEFFCKGAKTILHKIVSIGLSNAWQILEDPDLDVRILHLVRDPRGNLASRHNLPAFSLQNMKQFDSESLNAKHHCSNIQEDLLEVNRLKLQYPNRYMLVRYEDLMTSGIGKLARWLDIEKPLSIASAYASRTIIPYEMSSQFHPFSTLKISDQVWQRWRLTGSFSWVQGVQSSCALVLDKLGYRQYNNLQDYKNMSLQPILPIL